MCFVIFFFFSSRRRHTRWTGDWSSDVCSSDLAHPRRVGLQPRLDHAQVQGPPAAAALTPVVPRTTPPAPAAPLPSPLAGPHMRYQRFGFGVELHLFHHGAFDTQQPLPYPCKTHAVLQRLVSGPSTV